MDMQSADRHPAVQQLLKWVESTKVQGPRGIDGHLREVGFVSPRALHDYFSQEDVLEDLLHAHFAGDDDLLDLIDGRQIKKSFPMIFCLLIAIGKGRFIHHFMEYGIDDQRLPFSKEKPDYFPADPSDPQFFETFYQCQWQFCVPELDMMYGRRFDPSEWILPIRRVKKLGEGVSADIYQVEVNCFDGQLEAVRALQYEAEKTTGDTHWLLVTY